MRHRIIASLMLLSLATTAFAGDDAVKAGSGAKASKKALPAKAAAAQAAADAKKNIHQDPAQADKSIAAIDAQIAAAKINKSAPNWRTSVPMFKTVTFDPARSYYAQFITNKGVVLVKLRPDAAPAHVTNLIYLARMGFYDNLKFHRVITSFMAQGGCPLGTGTGGPAYGFGGEFQGNLKHNRPGMLSQANTGQPNSDGSQFFLTFVPTPHLDGRHTIWGEVVDGQATLKALEGKGTQQNNGMLATPIKIVRTWVSVAPKAKAETPKEADKPKDGDKK